MKNNNNPFEFMECVAILKTTGKKAGTLKEFRDTIAKISNDSIFHHTYQYFLKGHIMEHTNDFANWVEHVLNNKEV